MTVIAWGAMWGLLILAIGGLIVAAIMTSLSDRND